MYQASGVARGEALLLHCCTDTEVKKRLAFRMGEIRQGLGGTFKIISSGMVFAHEWYGRHISSDMLRAQSLYIIHCAPVALQGHMVLR